MPNETITTTLRSACCNAKTIVEGSKDFGDDSPEDVSTCHYVCTKCGQPCDIRKDPEPAPEKEKEEKEKPEETDVFNISTEEKTKMVNYIGKGIISDFSKVPTIAKLSMFQNVKDWKGKYALVKKRKIGKKEVRGKWVDNLVPYIEHQDARKIMNFCFNFNISVRIIGEDLFLEHDEEYKVYDKITKKSTTKTRTVYEATVVREYTLTDDKGIKYVRPVRASAKAYSNTAQSVYTVIEMAESKTWTKLGKTFGVADDLKEDERRAYEAAAKETPQQKKGNTPPPPSDYGY